MSSYKRLNPFNAIFCQLSGTAKFGATLTTLPSTTWSTTSRATVTTPSSHHADHGMKERWISICGETTSKCVRLVVCPHWGGFTSTTTGPGLPSDKTMKSTLEKIRDFRQYTIQKLAFLSYTVTHWRYVSSVFSFYSIRPFKEMFHIKKIPKNIFIIWCRKIFKPWLWMIT